MLKMAKWSRFFMRLQFVARGLTPRVCPPAKAWPKPANMILVSHAYLGGTRREWWTEYKV